MLSRVLEPEAMDTPAEARAYDAMDHSEVNRRFVDDVLAAWCHSERSEESRAVFGSTAETLRCAQGDRTAQPGGRS
jgi:hypothetical protein